MVARLRSVGVIINTYDAILVRNKSKAGLRNNLLGGSNPWYTGGGYVARDWPPGSQYRAKGRTWGSFDAGGNAPVTVEVKAWQVDPGGTCEETPSAITSSWGDTGDKWTETRSVLDCGGGYHYYYALSIHKIGYSGSNQLGGSSSEN